MEETHNIVAIFASNINHEYQVVNGSVFTESYNEELNSANIIIAHVKAADRLTDIKPYDYVCIKDKKATDGAGSCLYLVDNFTEDQTRLEDGDMIYSYTIALMSETKWLEKIQCPNLTITHKVKEDGATDKLTIFEYIRRYMELYTPKIKHDVPTLSNTWRYEPLIKVPDAIVEIAETETNFLDDYYGGNITLYKDRSAIKINTNDYTELQGLTFEFDIVGTNEDNIQISIQNNTRHINFKFPNFWFFNATINNGSETKQQNYILGQEVIIAPNQTKVININTKMTGIVSLTVNNIDTNTFIDINGVGIIYTDFYQRFSTTSADLSFNVPTMRQLLTTLMQQVGCIPVVKNRTLSYLDFQTNSIPLVRDDTFNKITRSLSSDSYVNSLIDIAGNVLDSENEVICEHLGFRDANNLLLRQTENLQLETKFPIYKITEAAINIPSKYTATFKVYPGPASYSGQGWYPGITNINVFRGYDNIYSMGFNLRTVYSYGSYHNTSGGEITIEMLNVHLCYASEDNTYVNYKTINLASIVNKIYYPRNSTDYGTITYYTIKADGTVETRTEQDTIANENLYIFTIQDDNQHRITDGWIEAYCKGYDAADGGSYKETYLYNPIHLNMILYNADGTTEEISGNPQSKTFNYMWKQDITALFKENSIRSTLNTNFKSMTNLASIDDLAKFVYGTVGYSIGSTTITGFSQTYSKAVGWWQETYTYIENIVKFLNDHFQELVYKNMTEELKSFFGGLPSLGLLGENKGVYIKREDWTKREDGTTDSSANYAGLLYFDIKYQPLNSFNMTFAKGNVGDDIPIEIAQYNSSASGITDFDRLSINEQEQVNRIGNETINLNQVTTSFSQIKDFSNGPLVYDDVMTGIPYTIFRRQYNINNYHIDANYTGSKDAIIKNYFTSIRTKYRAYQYVDYNQSVLRKERNVVYVLLSEKGYFNGDDNILLNSDNFTINSFISGINTNIDTTKKIQYKYDYSLNKEGNEETTKNDISIISNDMSFSIIYEESDNIGSGTYLGTYIVNTDIGGTQQEWQIWNEVYNYSHEIGYLLDIRFLNNEFVTPAQTAPDYDTIKTEVDLGYEYFYNFLKSDSDNSWVSSIFQICHLPIIDNENVTNYWAMKIVDNNNSDNTTRTFYKDYSERINHTTQFIYYTDSYNIKWTEHFIENNDFVARNKVQINAMYYSNDLTLDKADHDIPSGDVRYTEQHDISSVVFLDEQRQRIRVRWPYVNFPSGKNVLKLCYAHTVNGETKVQDIIAFRKLPSMGNYADFYVSLNDTKSEYVLDTDENGVLYKRGKVNRNTNNRTYTNLN